MTVEKNVKVDKRLVRFLREGVRQEINASVLELQVQLEMRAIDVPAFEAALAGFDECRALFEFVGFVDSGSPEDLVVDLVRWPRLVLRVLEGQYAAERARLEDARAVGVAIPERDLPALGTLIAGVRRSTRAPGAYQPRRQSFLERQLAKRRNRRRRGEK